MMTQNLENPFTKNPKDMARETIRVLRAKLDPKWIAGASAKIAECVLALPAVQNARTIGCYLATPREVQTMGLVKQLIATGKSVCVPAWNRGTAGYAMCEFTMNEEMHQGHLGVYEPLHPRWATTYVDAMVVPVVAFDRFLNRLGHGGGYFDRLLSSHIGTKIGLAFEAQRLAALPVEKHDVPMNLVVTEQRIYDGKNPWAGLINAPAEMVQRTGA
jgi:5-formyltetrahydrofolate cyclo-ligase